MKNLAKTEQPVGGSSGGGDARNEVILLEEDLKNLSKTEQPAGGDGGGDACATKHIKSKIRQLQNEQKSPSSNLKCPEVPPSCDLSRLPKSTISPKLCLLVLTTIANPTSRLGKHSNLI